MIKTVPFLTDDNAASARQPTLISGKLEDSDDDEDDEEGYRKMKPKHIRWQLEDGKEDSSGTTSSLDLCPILPTT